VSSVTKSSFMHIERRGTFGEYKIPGIFVAQCQKMAAKLTIVSLCGTG
jgi:hypothetical protein